MTTFIEELDEALICTHISDVTHDVKSFSLETVEPQQLRFDAGQHLTIRVEVDGAEVERCYTISSPPTRPGALSITVKRVPGGPVSNWLHDNLTVGDKLNVSGPLGRFSMVHSAIPVPIRGERDHAADVDDADAARPMRSGRPDLRIQRANAAGHHLPRRTR
jgi:NADPH-dependent ferric siderophore reductase